FAPQQLRAAPRYQYLCSRTDSPRRRQAVAEGDCRAQGRLRSHRLPIRIGCGAGAGDAERRLGAGRLIIALAAIAVVTAGAYLYWRHVWFFRDPPRTPPAAPGLVSPADGTVVYVRRVAPGGNVVVIKEGLSATVEDILHEHVDEPKLVIGIFMSP